jgi:hypothetical protein
MRLVAYSGDAPPNRAGRGGRVSDADGDGGSAGERSGAL